MNEVGVSLQKRQRQLPLLCCAAGADGAVEANQVSAEGQLRELPKPCTQGASSKNEILHIYTFIYYIYFILTHRLNVRFSKHLSYYDTEPLKEPHRSTLDKEQSECNLPATCLVTGCNRGVQSDEVG